MIKNIDSFISEYRNNMVYPIKTGIKKTSNRMEPPDITTSNNLRGIPSFLKQLIFIKRLFHENKEVQ